MRFLLLTTNKRTLGWRSFRSKVDFIEETLGSGMDVLEIDATPEVKNGRITHEWMEKLITPYFNNGYDVVALHGSMQQKKDWGVKTSLRGSNPNSKKEFGDFYFFADERTKREGENQFEQTLLHEFAHEYYQQTGLNDMTHYYHKQNPDISGLFKTFNWFKYQPRRMALKKTVKLLELIVGLLRVLSARKTLTGHNGRLLPLVQRNAQAMVDEMAIMGHKVRITEGFRTNKRQTELYNQGRTTYGQIVTNAKAGQSLHNYGVAVDFVFRKEGYDASEALWQTLGAVGERHGFEWGGTWKGFKDYPHFEMTLDYKLSDFQQDKIDWTRYS